MRLYLDDDHASPALALRLTNAGHDVQMPAEVGLAGRHDATQLRHSAQEDRGLLSGNHDDFKALHELVLAVGGHHPGILIVRRDNDPRRDLSPRGIVRAIDNLLAAGVPLSDEFIILNHWR